MSIDKFKKPESIPGQNPVDYFNQFGDWVECVHKVKGIEIVDDRNFSASVKYEDSSTHRILDDGMTIEVVAENHFNHPIGFKFTKFQFLTLMRFGGNHQSAYSFINYKYLSREIPFLRVGVDYYKIVMKPDVFGIPRRILKAWKKDEIKEDHGKQIFNMIPRFEDFIIYPDNKEYQPVISGCYNLYAPFDHEPFREPVTDEMIPFTMTLMNHVFGDQLELGFKYLKILYEQPRQILPILVLVSNERQTGKTTVLNWLNMIFGANFVLINPHDLTNDHNSTYATKNIIAIDETVLEKSSATEKLKSLTTAKSITVNPKYVAQYTLPFYGKVIMATNNEKRFAKIDEEEIRFWVRKLKPIDDSMRNTSIEDDLKNEIPMLLRYLEDLPDVDMSKSRMVFTVDELRTDEIDQVKKESKTWLYHDLREQMSDYMMTNSVFDIYATKKMIRDFFFKYNPQVTLSFITKVVEEEFKIQPDINAQGPREFGYGKDTRIGTKTGNFYHFRAEDLGIKRKENSSRNEEPFNFN